MLQRQLDTAVLPAAEEEKAGQSTHAAAPSDE